MTGNRRRRDLRAVLRYTGAMSQTEEQLELLGSNAEVPQANNVRLLVRLMEAVDDGVRQVAELAEALAVEERTARYYADLARWLGFVRQTDRGEWAPTQTGGAFADSVAARGRLFSQAIFQKDVVRLANQYKRQALDQGRELSTREACLMAIERSTDLSESTAHRRASGLASMLDAAYRPSRIDWQTGQWVDDRRHPALEFDGESFLTALAMKKLGVSHQLQVGLPRQVWRFVCGQAHQLAHERWKRASWQEDGVQWFGSVPVNDMTREIALRKGRDLRQLLVITVPYVTLTCAFLALRDPLQRPLTSMTEDMYGTRMWFHETDLGQPRELVERLARGLDLELRDRPVHLDGVDAPDAAPADDQQLIDLLEEAGIVRRRDTVIELAPGVREEWHEESADAPSVEERLGPLREEILEVLRRSD